MWWCQSVQALPEESEKRDFSKVTLVAWKKRPIIALMDAVSAGILSFSFRLSRTLSSSKEVKGKGIPTYTSRR